VKNFEKVRTLPPRFKLLMLGKIRGYLEGLQIKYSFFHGYSHGFFVFYCVNFDVGTLQDIDILF